MASITIELNGCRWMLTGPDSLVSIFTGDEILELMEFRNSRGKQWKSRLKQNWVSSRIPDLDSLRKKIKVSDLDKIKIELTREVATR